MVCAAGSMPGDLHKLWRARDPKGYHLEYGYSCMGYEVAGAMGVKLCAPDREVFAMVGDGSWLMMPSEIVTALQEGVKLVVVLVENGGYASIGGLSESLGSEGFGTRHRRRGPDGQLSGDGFPIDFVANAASLGIHAVRARTVAELREALATARRSPATTRDRHRDRSRGPRPRVRVLVGCPALRGLLFRQGRGRSEGVRGCTPQAALLPLGGPAASEV